MGDTGIILVQHGDFPFDFKEKQKEMFHFIESMLEKISDETRPLKRRPDDCYACDMALISSTVKRVGGFSHFEIGYMEFSSPTIEEAVLKLASQGLKKIVLVNSPGVMMRSSHSLLDIPAILKEITVEHPALELIYARPGIPFQPIADLFVKRTDSVLGKNVKPSPPLRPHVRTEEFGVVMIAHGDVPLEYLDSRLGMADKHIGAWSDMVVKWPRNEANDPLSYDTMKLEALIREKGGYDNFTVGNLEFTSPTLEEALDKVLTSGAKSVFFIGGTGFCDRSSHTMMDIPQAVEKLQKTHPNVRMTYAYPDIGSMCEGFAAVIVDKVYDALEKGGMPL